MKTATIILSLIIVLLCSESIQAFQSDFKPGEGLIDLKVTKRTFDAGNYEVELNLNVQMKYRFSTLLGDHVEVFYPKYEILDIGSIIVTDKESGFELFRITESYSGDRIEQIPGEGTPIFLVGSEITKKLQMTSLNFRLTRFIAGSGLYFIDRKFPGYLREPEKWGWDVPGSFSWEDVLSKNMTGDVDANEARRVWNDMVLESEPIYEAELIDASFYVYGLMFEITKKYPDAFRNQPFISPAFAQMSSLVGQLNQAKDNRDPDFERREQLTNRAWGLLSDEMSPSERNAIEEMRDLTDNSAAIEELESLFTTIEDDYADDEELSDQNRNRLDLAISKYSPIKISQLRLPSKLIESLEMLASAGLNWQELEVAYNQQNYRYGYKNSSGEWVIDPIFMEAHPFNNALAIVRGDEPSPNLYVIDMKGNRISRKFSNINDGTDYLIREDFTNDIKTYKSRFSDDVKLVSTDGVICAQLSWDGGAGLYSLSQKAWIKSPRNRFGCEHIIARNFEVFKINGPEVGGLRTKEPSRREMEIYDSKGQLIVSDYVSGIGINKTRNENNEYSNYDIQIWNRQDYICGNNYSLTYITDRHNYDIHMNLISSTIAERSYPSRNHWACK